MVIAHLGGLPGQGLCRREPNPHATVILIVTGSLTESGFYSALPVAPAETL